MYRNIDRFIEIFYDGEKTNLKRFRGLGALYIISDPKKYNIIPAGIYHPEGPLKTKQVLVDGKVFSFVNNICIEDCIRNEENIE